MSEKFLGVGFTNLILIWVTIMLLNLVTKVVFTKYHVDGISEIVQAS